MALKPFAEVHEVEAVWGELTVTEEVQVGAWLITASNNLRLIGLERGISVDDYIDGNELREQAAKDAVIESIRRRLMNPDGIRQRSKSVVTGPTSETESETIDTAISAGGLYFNADDLRWLPKRSKRRFGVMRARSGYFQ